MNARSHMPPALSWQLAQARNAFGLKSARRQLGLTQTELAARLDMGPNGARTIQRWELGKQPVPGPVATAIILLGRIRELENFTARLIENPDGWEVHHFQGMADAMSDQNIWLEPRPQDNGNQIA